MTLMPKFFRVIAHTMQGQELYPPLIQIPVNMINLSDFNEVKRKVSGYVLYIQPSLNVSHLVLNEGSCLDFDLGMLLSQDVIPSRQYRPTRRWGRSSSKNYGFSA